MVNSFFNVPDGSLQKWVIELNARLKDFKVLQNDGTDSGFPCIGADV